MLPTAPSFARAISLLSRLVCLSDAPPTERHSTWGRERPRPSAAVLSESIAKDVPVPGPRDAFMLRRYEQNKLVVEPSLWTEDRDEHPTPDADFAGLTAKSRDGTAQPT